MKFSWHLTQLDRHPTGKLCFTTKPILLLSLQLSNVQGCAKRCSCIIFVQKSASCSLVPDQARFFPGISCISRRSHSRDIAAALSNPLMQLIKSLIILPCPFFKSLCKKYLRKGLQKHNLCKRYFWLKCAKSTCSQFWRSPALTCSN